jgi:hypothetical protein
MPVPRLLLPAAFCSANLIIYWGGFDTTWKLVCAVAGGLILFALGAWWNQTGAQHAIRSALWIAAWLAGQVIIGFIGRYGAGAQNVLPNWIDLAVVIIFAVTIFYWAVSLSMSGPETLAAISRDANQLAGGSEP